MTLLVATLGFHPEKLIQAIPTSGATEVWFYVAPGTTPTKQRRADKAARAVERALRALGVPFVRKSLPHPFGYVKMLQRFVDDLTSAADRDVVFNLTGGPKTMTVAATVACLLQGVPVLYVPEDEQHPQPVALPILRMRYAEILPPRTRRVLEAIQGTGPCLIADLARELGLSHSTVDYHILRLEHLKAVIWVKTGKRRRVSVSEAGLVLLLGIGRELSTAQLP